jgi:Carboxypeptidase regulatory-like domain
MRSLRIWLILVTLVFLAYAEARTTTSALHGTVTRARAPVSLPARVTLSPGNASLDTDAAGRYSFSGIAPGRYSVLAHCRGGASATKTVQLGSGDDLTLDFDLPAPATISGRIVDQSKRPIAGVEVALATPEFHLGSLHDVYVAVSQTDDLGHYEFSDVPTQRDLILLVKPSLTRLEPLSNAPRDRELRRHVIPLTWYPDTPSVEAAEAFLLHPGEHREGMDIRVIRSPSYCVDGTLGAGPFRFWMKEAEPVSGSYGGRSMFVASRWGDVGPSGKFRICDLAPGAYRLTAFKNSAEAMPSSFGEAEVQIADKDVHNLPVFLHPLTPVRGTVELSPQSASPTSWGQANLRLIPMDRAIFHDEFRSLMSTLPLPGDFTFPGLISGDYSFEITGLPDGLYVKDIVYGGRSLLHQPMRVGAAPGNDLEVFAGTDGGNVSATVTDSNGVPIPDCTVVLIPSDVTDEASLADALTSGQTDQNGAYKSSTVRPGDYTVLALTHSVTFNPTTLSKLLRARTDGEKISVISGGTAAAALHLLSLQ